MHTIKRQLILGISLFAAAATVAAGCEDDETATPNPSTTATTSSSSTTGGGMGGSAGGMGGGGTGGTGGMGTGGQAPGCFMGGTDANAAAADGKCGDPIIIDMTGMQAGDVVFHTVNSNQHGDETATWIYGGCSDMDFTGAANDYVFQVLVDQAVERLDVSVDGTGGTADPMVAIIEDVGCGQGLNACSNANAAGQCEWVGGTNLDGVWFGTGPYVLVSEVVDSNEDVTVRFRIDGTP